MKNYLRLLIACICWLNLVCSLSCTKPPHKNIICYIDFSENPNFDKRVNYYNDVMNNSIIGNMSFEDRIVVLPIDNGTLTNSSEIIIDSLKKQSDYVPDGTSPLDEDAVAQKNADTEKKKISKDLTAKIQQAKLDRSGLKKGTDIIGALSSANKYYEDGQDNIVIFLSDMMNWSNNLKMEEGSFNASMIDSKLAELPKIDGKSANVLIHTGDLTNISEKHFNILNQFWTKYFQNNKFTLVDYSSGSTSKLDELVKAPLSK